MADYIPVLPLCFEKPRYCETWIDWMEERFCFTWLDWGRLFHMQSSWTSMSLSCELSRAEGCMYSTVRYCTEIAAEQERTGIACGNQ